MNYFKFFPKTFNSRDGFANDIKFVTNIMSRFNILRSVLNNTTAFHSVTLHQGDRPDTVAHKYYGSSDYTWLVLLSNQYIDSKWEWPLDDDEFENLIKTKYGSLADARTRIVRYEKKVNGRFYQVDSTDFLSGYTSISEEGFVFDAENNLSSDFRAITAYKDEFDRNEKKREIQLIDRALLSHLEKELRNVFDG